jgi:type IV pilus assembly protein PilB
VAGNRKLTLGEVLVEEGILTSEDLGYLLALQKEEAKPLGELCIEQGYLSRYALKLILKKYHRRMMIGELLVVMGIIKIEHLREALDFQKKDKKRIGQVLIERKLITEEDLAAVLSEQLGIPRIIPDPALVDQSLLSQVNHRFIVSNEVLPTHTSQNGVTVIMADPLAEETLKGLEAVYQRRILPAVATRSEIVHCLGLLVNQQSVEKLISKNDFELNTQKDLTIATEEYSAIESDRVVSMVNYIISQAVLEGASDVHLEPQEDKLRVRYRVDGVLRVKTDLPKDTCSAIASRIKALGKMNIAEKRRHQDGRLEAKVHGKEIDLRISSYPCIYGETLVIRILNRHSYLMALEQLGFSPANLASFTRLLDCPSGMILVTGPTGSGKTTTLYASLQLLVERGLSIITVEDPVEYTLGGVVQSSYESKLGLVYADYIKAMMRQDPDVIMVGEIRDIEVARAAVQSALTGHRVFSTFHTEDTTGALVRLADMGIENYLIAYTTQGVLTQRLLRTICHYCKEQTAVDPKTFLPFGRLAKDLQGLPFYRGKGCQRCGQSGFKGRIGVHELLILNDPLRDGLFLRKTTSELRHLARTQANLVSMMEDALYKALKGFTTLEEVLRVIPVKETDQSVDRNLEKILQLCSGEKEAAEILTASRSDRPKPREGSAA